MRAPSATIPGLGQFLGDYPLMALRPRADKPPVLVGRFAFTARHGAVGQVTDAFDLEIEVPPAFPAEVPKVTETGGRIPKLPDEHVNRVSGTLCLGSPLRLLSILAKDPTLTGFAEGILVPYLFAHSRRQSGDEHFAFGELAHGWPGMLADYVAMFRLKRAGQAIEALRLLGMKKRRANKQACPCGCGKRLGKCRFNFVIRDFRAVASRPWFREQHQEIPPEFRSS